MPETPRPRDAPWIVRTYAGHSTAAASNRLYRANLAKGQTGLSVAFDLPTQTGYDSDHELARGEVGKVGVPVCHLGDMRALFDGIPLDRMNTSMTINATAPWLLALYVAAADEAGLDRAALAGTTQNDIVKEYLSRGTYMVPPEPSMRLTTDLIAWACREVPKWNPVNICSYHLQEAGATPVQELAFALANAVAVVDRLRACMAEDDFPAAVGRISFFVNAGIRFVTEICKMRAFTELWDELCASRWGIEDPRYRRFRYGVQVNSLGLTEQQPENNVARILFEMLAVTLSKDARARAVQLPAWNEALGLPRPWDQQWSLRMQQILAYETDLLEFDDIFRGSEAVATKVAEMKAEALAELDTIEKLGGAVAAVEKGYMKKALVDANTRRLEAIERGEHVIVGVNAFTESEPSPLSTGAGAVVTVPEWVERDQIERLEAWRSARDAAAVAAALERLRRAARAGENVMEPSVACAKVGVTTGEWGFVMREAFGAYRAPTGVSAAPRNDAEGLDEARAAIDTASRRLGRRLRVLVGKPGLDGHSNGAEQIAARLRDGGAEAIYPGIRHTPAELVAIAREQGVDVVGLSVLSGSHVPLVGEVMALMGAEGLDVPVVAGGIIPPEDAERLKAAGVAAVFSPKDFRLNDIVVEIAQLVGERDAEPLDA